MKNKAALIISIILFVAVVLLIGASAHGASTVRYLNKTIDVDSTQSIKYNTQVQLLKFGKKQSVIEYNGQQYEIRTEYLSKKKAVNKWKGRSFKKRGRGKWNKCSWTWYSTRQRCGKVRGVKGKHVSPRGLIMDKDGYIVLASGRKNKKKRVIVPTPFGYYGKVYDTNGRNNNKWFDVNVNW